MARGLLAPLLLSASLAAPAAAETVDPQLVRRLKPSVVNIETRVSQPLNGDEAGRWIGTGFVIDAARGIIATNRHVSGSSPASYKIVFSNGESSTDVRLLYHDPWHDFAFLKLDPAALQFPLQKVVLGGSRGLREQDKVFLIGNNAAQEYTVLYGDVINVSDNNPFSTPGDRHGAVFQVSYGNRGGSSGSPIFDASGEVVGIHFKGTGSNGFELRIEYLKDALAHVQAGKDCCPRGDVGTVLDLKKVSDAQKHFQLPEEVARRIKSAGNDIKNALGVAQVVPESPAEGKLQPGDVVVSIDGRVLGDDLYEFDKAVDVGLGRTVDIGIVRSGAELNVTLAPQDAGPAMLRRFAQFGGAVLHELTAKQRLAYNIHGPGVFMPHVAEGSPLAELGVHNEKEPAQRAVVIVAVNGIPTPDLDAFIRQASGVADGSAVNITIRDFNAYNNGPKAVPLTVDLQFGPLKEFRRDRIGEWSEAPRGPGM